jgi:hypothetical protein
MDRSVILAAASTGVRRTSAHDMEDPAASTGADEHGEFDRADAEADTAADRDETKSQPVRAVRPAPDNQALARLIGRVMRQDEAALAMLYEHLSGRVYALALHITRPRR